MAKRTSASQVRAQAFEALRAYSAVPQAVRKVAEAILDRQEGADISEFSGEVSAEFRLPGAKFVEVRARFRKGAWETEVPASYSDFTEILHACMLAAIAQASGLDLPLPGEKVNPATLKEPVKEKELTYSEPLTEIITARLKRSLSGPEKEAVRIIERIFKSAPPSVSEADLRAIAGMKAKWSYTYHTAWPARPATAWETWLYLMRLMQRLNIEVPEFLREATPGEMVEKLVHDWEQKVRIQQWREFLRQPADSAVKAPEETFAPMLRARISDKGLRMEYYSAGREKWVGVENANFVPWEDAWREGRLELDAASEAVWLAWMKGDSLTGVLRYGDAGTVLALRALMRAGLPPERFAGEDGGPLELHGEPARWRIEEPAGDGEDYRWSLETASGQRLENLLCVQEGDPSLIVTSQAVIQGPPLGGLARMIGRERSVIEIPAAALESGEGAVLFERTRTPMPRRLEGKVRCIRRRPLMRAELRSRSGAYDGEILVVQFTTIDDEGRTGGSFSARGWEKLPVAPAKNADGMILRLDDSALGQVYPVIMALELQYNWPVHLWDRKAGKNFAAEFHQWLSKVPDGLVLELSPELNSLRDPAVQGSLSFDFTENETGIDWFDLRVGLTTDDATLTKAEIALLLKARGGFVRLGAKGWRRLAFQMTPEQEQELADLGLTTGDFTGEPQRIHALQLAGSKTARQALPPEQAIAIERRAQDIRTRSTPPVPEGMKASLRPYQLEGYHFLSYLTANRFGGILADDMGLGKTVQTLAWLLWLRAGEKSKHPVLVVCPKSVVENWAAEARKFAPSLRTVRLPRGAAGADVKAARACADLMVCNYAQLRLLEAELKSAPWHAVILDEAQAIKNPQSQTAITAGALIAPHRLALSGTPIENRLLDLWSLMNFAMPGVLGNRTAFQKLYDSKTDAFARRRLAARVRPFVLRRTKGEVARDLPDRVEEDIHCELEGVQAKLYQAELKRARAALLGIRSSKELDKARFSILTSLLRLRQICCHPALLTGSASDESSKMSALLELLEPLMEEGHKVLVFSQFVEMLDMIRTELDSRGWRQFMLTGKTEERGRLVTDFQKQPGAAVFLISLKAGGSGLNLTAASYVVLFDPWWNPAVENQAIDRTHRIGQTQKVIAYRLLVKESIEEKIRALQQQKNAMAVDILGEESFAKALTLEDFSFLLSE